MFSKSKKEPPATPVKTAKRGGSFSVIGADAVIVGDLVTAENLQVNGRIQGDVRCGALHQGASGVIAGNIVAEEARLEGLVEGAVSAGLLVLAPSARVTGDITYETLSVEGGARVDGRFTHICVAGGNASAGPLTVVSDPDDTFCEDIAEAAE